MLSQRAEPRRGTNRTKLTGWRKIANALWRMPSDPQIYGALEIDATACLALIDEARARGHAHVTATHLVGRAVAHALVAVPDLNVRLIGDYAIARPSADVFFITAIAGGRDLTGVKITDVEGKSVVDVANELSDRSARMKAGHDPDFARSKRVMEMLPGPLLHVALRGIAWLTGDLARRIPLLGLDASPFGSAMVSSVGMLGLPMGFSPLVWMYRVPLLVVVGEIADKPVAIDGRVEIRPMLPITASIDHRYVDGAQLGKALHAFREYLANPKAHEPTLASSPPASQPMPLHLVPA